jgi:hypothetical protein
MCCIHSLLHAQQDALTQYKRYQAVDSLLCCCSSYTKSHLRYVTKTLGQIGQCQEEDFCKLGCNPFDSVESDVISQKAELFITTAVRASDPKFRYFREFLKFCHLVFSGQLS